MATSDLQLKHDLAFEDLYGRAGLARLDAAFVAWLASADADLHNRLVTARRDPDALDHKAHSQLLIDLAPQLEDFVGDLFGIEAEVRALQARHHALSPLYAVKRLFVQRRAVKGMTPEKAATLDGSALGRELEALMGEALTEPIYAGYVSRWMAAEAEHGPALDLAARYAAWATLSPEGQARHGHGVGVKVPHKVEMTPLIPVQTVVEHGVTMLRLGPEHGRASDGFALTDAGMDLTAALDHANYCNWCHNQGKDSCSRGLKDKKSGTFQ